MSRVKKKTFVNVSLEKAQEASGNYAAASNQLNKVKAKMESELTKVRSKYQVEITTLNEALEEPEELLHTFANEQKENWGKKKSFELLHCTIGFRTGTPKVEKDKKFTWDAILELLKKKSVFSLFVRPKDEINKEAILAEKDERLLAKLKDECFIGINQDETWFVTTKEENVIVTS